MLFIEPHNWVYFPDSDLLSSFRRTVGHAATVLAGISLPVYRVIEGLADNGNYRLAVQRELLTTGCLNGESVVDPTKHRFSNVAPGIAIRDFDDDVNITISRSLIHKLNMKVSIRFDFYVRHPTSETVPVLFSSFAFAVGLKKS